MLHLNGFIRSFLALIVILLIAIFVRILLSRPKRTKSKPVVKKKPFSPQIIKPILDLYSKEDANLKDLRVASLCSLAFAGFLPI